jgi:hypothetical protein
MLVWRGRVGSLRFEPRHLKFEPHSIEASAEAPRLYSRCAGGGGVSASYHVDRIRSLTTTGIAEAIHVWIQPHYKRLLGTLTETITAASRTIRADADNPRSQHVL